MRKAKRPPLVVSEERGVRHLHVGGEAIQSAMRLEDPYALALMATGFGIAYGGFVATFPTVVMDLFGPRSVAGIIGCIYTAAGVGTLFGPPVAGAAFDATGSYGAPILGAAALALVGAAGMRLLRDGR